MLHKINQTQTHIAFFSLPYEIHRVKTSEKEGTVREGDREEGEEGEDR